MHCHSCIAEPGPQLIAIDQVCVCVCVCMLTLLLQMHLNYHYLASWQVIITFFRVDTSKCIYLTLNAIACMCLAGIELCRQFGPSNYTAHRSCT